MINLLAAEGGYQVFHLSSGDKLWLLFSGVTALLAIAVGFYLMRGVLAAAFAIFEALLFLVSEHQEMEAMHGSWFRLCLAGLLALGFAAFLFLSSCFDTLCGATRQIDVFTSLLSQIEFLL